jgi:hypothetical protein
LTPTAHEKAQVRLLLILCTLALAETQYALLFLSEFTVPHLTEEPNA